MATAQTRVEVIGYIGPNWFASVMGTGIVATAGATLPVHVPGLPSFARVVWVVAAVCCWCSVVAVGRALGAHPTVARSHARNPQMAHFYGAAPMALLTVGAGALLVGQDLIGERAAVDLAWVLWTAGTVGGLFTAVEHPLPDVHPARRRTRRRLRRLADAGRAADGVGGHRCAADPAHGARAPAATTMLYGCYAMFGLSLIASLIIITMIWSRLVHFGTSGTARVPTLWIVLGPLGQSITVAGLLGTDAASAVDPRARRRR